MSVTRLRLHLNAVDEDHRRKCQARRFGGDGRATGVGVARLVDMLVSIGAERKMLYRDRFRHDAM